METTFENLENAVGYKTIRAMDRREIKLENLENAVGYKTIVNIVSLVC